MNVQPPTGTNRKPYMELDTNDLGYPVLPDPMDWPKKGMEKKALIRSYVVMAYREYLVLFLKFSLTIYGLKGQATGKDQSAPWNSILQNASNFFDPDQVPEGFTLMDPSKMKDPQVNEILEFWHERQEKNDDGIGFRFREDPNCPNPKRQRDESEPVTPEPPTKRRKGPPVVEKKASNLVKGKQKGKQKAQSPGPWTDHIQPDSRRRRVRIRESSPSSDSGESFDFTAVNAMLSDHEDGDGEGSGQSSSTKVPIPQVMVTSRTTFGPRSKQEKLGMATSVNGPKISTPPPSMPARRVTRSTAAHDNRGDEHGGDMKSVSMVMKKPKKAVRRRK